MVEQNSPEKREGDSDALGQVIAILKPLSPEDRDRVLRTIATFFDLQGRSVKPVVSSQTSESLIRPRRHIYFSEDLDVSPKDFIMQKQPRTDVERVAALAYYLAHYRNTPHFKTLDISKLNTEAALPKFANTAWASNNALKMGYLANSTRGNRQLSAAGERFVEVLPDREAARKAMQSFRPRKRSRRNATVTAEAS